MRETLRASSVYTQNPVSSLHTTILVCYGMGQNSVNSDFLDLAIRSSGQSDSYATGRILLVKQHNDHVVGTSSFFQTRLFDQLRQFLLRDQTGAARQRTDTSKLFAATSVRVHIGGHIFVHATVQTGKSVMASSNVLRLRTGKVYLHSLLHIRNTHASSTEISRRWNFRQRRFRFLHFHHLVRAILAQP